MVFNGLRGAEFTAGTLKSTIERKPDGEYEMFFGRDRMLAAHPPTPSLDALEITCGDGAYRAHISFLRNVAKVSSMKGEETALLKGNVVGRRYEIKINEADPAALPGTILLLYHTAAFRRRVYLT